MSNDDNSSPEPELLNLAASAIKSAATIDLSSLKTRIPIHDDAEQLSLWPGQHYRLLAGLIEVVQPTIAVEIGTFRGMGALAMRYHLRGRLVTYDVASYDSFTQPCLTAQDFDRHLEQRIGDLSDPDYFAAQQATLNEAGVIFIDGPKDGKFERRFSELLLRLQPRRRVLMFDDTRLLRMIGFWRWLPLPKIDLTSFGHYTGTGVALL